MEFILCAAIKFNDTIVSGYRHGDCYEVIESILKPYNNVEIKLPTREDQGFLTSLNRFVDRKEAWNIAKANNQIKYGLDSVDPNEEPMLISENLY